MPDTVSSPYVILADLVLATHFMFAAFVVVSLALVVLGGLLNWPWIRNSWFRTIHLMSTAIVIVQSWMGVICPLTTLEMWLRRQGGESAYDGSFVQYWLQKFLFFDAPACVFVAVYSAFGLLVLFVTVKYPPDFMSSSKFLIWLKKIVYK